MKFIQIQKGFRVYKLKRDALKFAKYRTKKSGVLISPWKSISKEWGVTY